MDRKFKMCLGFCLILTMLLLVTGCSGEDDIQIQNPVTKSEEFLDSSEKKDSEIESPMDDDVIRQVIEEEAKIDSNPDNIQEQSIDTEDIKVEEVLSSGLENENENIQETTDTIVKSSPEHDMGVGINSIKYDYDLSELSLEQKLIAEYFNDDYMFVNNVDLLQRYPKIFDKALIECYTYVYKVISYDGDDYELLALMYNNSDEMMLGDSMLDSSRFVILKGTTYNTRILQKDIINVNGRYVGIETITVDGISLTVPIIDVNKSYIYGEGDWDVVWPYHITIPETTTMARSIFGDDITVRKDSMGDYPDFEEEYLCGEIGGEYVIEFDKPQNRRLEKLFIDPRKSEITSANDAECYLKFSEDASHFVMYYYSEGTDSITFEYYDNLLERKWKRDIKPLDKYEVYSISARLDMTEYCMYLCCGGMVYSINLQNGEDVWEEIYVGSDICSIRKFSDGLFLSGSGERNTFMFIDLSGKFVWRTDAPDEITGGYSIQLVDNRIIIKTGAYRSEKEIYYAIDYTDGTILFAGKGEVSLFVRYG